MVVTGASRQSEDTYVHGAYKACENSALVDLLLRMFGIELFSNLSMLIKIIIQILVYGHRSVHRS